MRIYLCSYKCRQVTSIHGLLEGYYFAMCRPVSYKHPQPSRGLLLIIITIYCIMSCGSIRLSPHLVVRINHCSYKCRPVTRIHGLLQGYYLFVFDVMSRWLFIITIYCKAVALLDSHLTGLVVRVYHCSYKCRPVTSIHGLLEGYYLSL